MQIRLEYRDAPVRSPLTPWVHKAADGKGWWNAAHYDPPMPPKIIGKGWPVWTVQHRGHEIVFASPEEIQHAIDVLGQKSLPLTRVLGRPHGAVNSHWLSRLHRSWKPWRVREKLVARLTATLAADMKRLTARTPKAKSGA